MTASTSNAQSFLNNQTWVLDAVSTYANTSMLYNKTSCTCTEATCGVVAGVVPVIPGSCTSVANLVYPFLGNCFFTHWRIRWTLTNTDITQVPLLRSITLLDINDDPVLGGIASLEGGIYPNVSSDPGFCTDNSNTSWYDPEGRALIISHTLGTDVRQVCINLGRENPSALLSIDGGFNTTGPWYISRNATLLATDACLLTDSLCTMPVVDPPYSRAFHNFSIESPANFMLMETDVGSGIWLPVPCPEYGACLIGNECAQYQTGPLCHQCTYVSVDGAISNGTRLREGELCGACPIYWLPWCKIGAFYVLCGIFVAAVMYVQHRAVVAPLYSPAMLADVHHRARDAKKYIKEMEINEYHKLGREVPRALLERDVHGEAEKEAVEEETTTLSPILLAGLVRHCLDHHVLCCIAWEYSGFALCWPEKSRNAIFMINMDWFNIMSMNCAGLTYFVDELLYYAVTAIPIHWCFFYLIAWIVFNDKCGCCTTPEQQLLTDRAAVEQAFARIDKNEDGALTKEEILKAIEPPPELKRMPRVKTMIHAAMVLFAFLQNPVYNRLFLLNLDCSTISGKSYMRVDLREECKGYEYNVRVYFSVGCFGIFSVASIMASLYIINKARRDTKASEDEDGYITCDEESAFAFMLAGLHTKCWWFSTWKMLLKEILPVLIVLKRSGEVPIDPGVGDSPGELALIGLLVAFVHEHIDPFEHMYAHPLGTVERLSWCAFCAPPLCKLLIGNKMVATMHNGSAIIGQWTKPAETFFQWCLIIFCFLLYLTPFFASAFFLVGEELGFTKVHTINMEIAERIHITLPPKGRERRQMCTSLAKLFEHAMLSVARMADEVDMPTLCPASTIEGALLIVMREDARYWGDVNAGAHAVLNIEHESVLSCIGLMQRDRERKDLQLSRAILDAGGLAETCLKQGIEIRGLKVDLGRDDEGNSILPPSMQGGDNHPDLQAGATVIFMHFTLENVALRSLGFIDGSRADDPVRPGVKRSLVRGIAVAVATGDDNIDMDITPVGVDRAVVTVAINCADNAEIMIREDWLRTSLGTRESRIRWAKGLEADLGRVGVMGSEEKVMMVRFSKESKPVRTTPEGARRMGLASIKAARMGDRAKPKEPTKKEKKGDAPKAEIVGKNRRSLIHEDFEEDCAYDNDGLGLARAMNQAHNAKPKSDLEQAAENGRDNGLKPRSKKSGKGKGRQARSAPAPEDHF